MAQQDALQFKYVYYWYRQKVINYNQTEPLALL